jgi:hypothetical protein
LATFATAAVLPGKTLYVKPTESLSTLGEMLANDASITEVIFEEGIYSGGLLTMLQRTRSSRRGRQGDDVGSCRFDFRAGSCNQYL